VILRALCVFVVQVFLHYLGKKNPFRLNHLKPHHFKAVTLIPHLTFVSIIPHFKSIASKSKKKTSSPKGKNMNKIIVAGIAIILIVNCYLGICQNDHSEEERSAIVEADGYAYLSENKTIKELREEAKTAAKREASEKGQTYIKSITKVENFQLSYDIIWGETEGYVRIIESKDYGITADNRYHYWIKAEVKYSLKEGKEQIPINIKTNELAPLTVSVWTEKNEYLQNEEIRIFIKGNKDFYAKVVYEDASGNLLQLLPNQYRKDNLFKTNQVYSVPDREDNFILKIQPPFGKEKITIYTSTAILGKIPVEQYGNSIYRVQNELKKDYSKKTRGVRIAESEQNNHVAEFYEANCTLITKDK